MNVKELIEELQNQDPDLLVLLASDAEGNGFKKLAGMQTYFYEEDGRNYEILDDEEGSEGDPLALVLWV
jgi:hypothetical protein